MVVCQSNILYTYTFIHNSKYSLIMFSFLLSHTNPAANIPKDFLQCIYINIYIIRINESEIESYLKLSLTMFHSEDTEQETIKT